MAVEQGGIDFGDFVPAHSEPELQRAVFHRLHQSRAVQQAQNAGFKEAES